MTNAPRSPRSKAPCQHEDTTEFWVVGQFERGTRFGFVFGRHQQYPPRKPPSAPPPAKSSLSTLDRDDSSRTKRRPKPPMPAKPPNMRLSF